MAGQGSSTTADWDVTNGQGYILNMDRSHAAAGRLNLQFFLWKEALGFNIHPSIQSSISKNAAIAEVASGSGMWLIDTSRELPQTQIDGFDYDMNQSPHPQWLPANVKISYLNILEDIPDHLAGKYDYVHTRLLLLVAEAGDPRPIIRNLKKLLKPGGYLQWDELDTVNLTVKKADPALLTPALDALRDWSHAGGRHDWTIRLDDFCAEEGLVDTKIEHYGDPPELARAFNDQHLLTAEEFAAGLAKHGKVEEASRYSRLIQEGYSESVSGAALCVPRVVCLARNPTV